MARIITPDGGFWLNADHFSITGDGANRVVNVIGDGGGTIGETFTTAEKEKLAAIEAGAQVNPTLISQLDNDSGFITISAVGLLNYYTKSETYTRDEVNTLLSELEGVKFEKVDTLPATGESGVIYLVPNGNVYDEYLYLEGAWEKIGDTTVDLTGYVTSDGLTAILADYITATGLATTLAAYSTTAQIDTKLESYALKTDVDTAIAGIEIPNKTSQLDNDSGFITSAALDDYATIDDLDTTLEDYVTIEQLTEDLEALDVPTKTSQLENDSDFTTQAYVTAYVDEKYGFINTALDNINGEDI